MFAADEPIIIDGVNSTTVLTRRVKQGVAEWFRLHLNEQTWKGLVEHALDGWNIGPAPYGYRADPVPHPVPVKASQGRTKTRLALDPVRARVVEQIFTWRVIHKLGMPTITAKLNADPARYPAPRTASGWTTQTVYAILRNPKYTGHMVYGRVRTRNGRRVPVPPDQWLWSPQPAHPPVIDRDTWDAAQHIGVEHGTSRDGHALSLHPAATRTYVYRGRVRCRDCRRRMGGQVYYQCPHNPARLKDTADHPGHPRTVKAPEIRLDQIVALFLAEHVFGPRRAELLAAQLPATDADAAADRDTQLAALTARLKQIDTAQKAQILSLEQLSPDPADTAATAMRARITDRFAELHHDREQVTTQLDALEAVVPQAIDSTLLEDLPLAGDILPGLDPAAKARLFAALRPGDPVEQDRRAGHRLGRDHRRHPPRPARHSNASQYGYDETADTTPGEDADVEDLFESPITGSMLHGCGSFGGSLLS